ncbi:sigma-70 family RNA polymerase sigma factor [Sphingosinicella sp. CPCC 101087]|uniref:sigma-70 family RNA polymerase sigma factor n=1 Tax=Sphingosinicella sp. CPCC 101087 TaxID=2497754 RepID=UPI00101CD4FD|nr:sigma-70 family RNA polymerase sigma factor [Sphingosinicella sp. CPCC 101087]
MSATAIEAGAAETFDPLRPRLIRIAYRMLGSLADAEDVVQEAFLRWLRSDRASVREPEAFLCRVVTRIAIDQLNSARRRREVYVGPWLPEPIVEPEEDLADDVTLPLLMALERLSPLERAAFLLHDIFGLPFEEVAETIGRDPAACRQLASRARTHVRATRPRFPVDRERGMEIAAAFFAASRSGDMKALRTLLADGVTVESDGGGKRPAAMRPIRGIEDVMRLHSSLARFFAKGRSRILCYGLINGLPGFVTREADGMLQTTALAIDGDRISHVYIVRNPEKLARLDGQLVH